MASKASSVPGKSRSASIKTPTKPSKVREANGNPPGTPAAKKQGRERRGEASPTESSAKASQVQLAQSSPSKSSKDARSPADSVRKAQAFQLVTTPAMNGASIGNLSAFGSPSSFSTFANDVKDGLSGIQKSFEHLFQPMSAGDPFPTASSLEQSQAHSSGNSQPFAQNGKQVSSALRSSEDSTASSSLPTMDNPSSNPPAPFGYSWKPGDAYRRGKRLGGHARTDVYEMEGQPGLVIKNTRVPVADREEYQRKLQDLVDKSKDLPKRTHFAQVLQVISVPDGVEEVQIRAPGAELHKPGISVDAWLKNIHTFANAPQHHYDELVQSARTLDGREYSLDPKSTNIYYHPKFGFTIIDICDPRRARDIDPLRSLTNVLISKHDLDRANRALTEPDELAIQQILSKLKNAGARVVPSDVAAIQEQIEYLRGLRPVRAS